MNPGKTMLPVILRKRGSASSFGRLGVAARVVPQDAGAQHLIAAVEQRRAMHVAGQADALDRCEFCGLLRLQVGKHCFGGGDPVGRILLGPARMRPRNLERARRRTDHGLIRIDQQNLDARRAEIDAEIHHVPPDRAERGRSIICTGAHPEIGAAFPRGKSYSAKAGPAQPPNRHFFRNPEKFEEIGAIEPVSLTHEASSNRPCRLRAS